MHTTVSYDGHSTGAEMLAAAEKMGLREICFTDHLDYDPLHPDNVMAFSTETYNAAYHELAHSDIKIRKGIEFGMLPDNSDTLKKDLQRRHFDFVIGSVHFVDGLDIYLSEFWKDITMDDAEEKFLKQTLNCVHAHNDFDVLGHLTYISKAGANPIKRPVEYPRYHELVDEILRALADKGKGIEVNTSGIDCSGVFLPAEVYLRRFKELGGEIITVGSDAHHINRVGQYCDVACRLVADIFGYVCTFSNRVPVFHRIT